MKKKLIAFALVLALCVTGAMFATGCKKPVYDVTYYAEDGTTVLTTVQVEEGQTVSAEAPGATEKAGYTIVWKTAEGAAYDFAAAVNGPLSLYLTYAPNEGVAYKVEHYFENLNGTYDIDTALTENLTGTTDADVAATAKTVEGFTFDAGNTKNVMSGKVKGDGSLTLKVYYERNEYAVAFMANGEQLASGKAKHGEATPRTNKTVADKNVTVTTRDTFKHWSLEENGAEYNFSTAVTGPVTLYAVYETVTREYVATVDLTNAAGLFNVTDEAGEALTSATVKAGEAFKFKVTLGEEADGAPVVKATVNNDIEGTDDVQTLTAENGVYSVTVTGVTTINVEVAAKVYTVSVMYEAPATEYYEKVGKQWANPYKGDDGLIVMTRNTLTGETLSHDGAAKNGSATVEVTAGTYAIYLAYANGDDFTTVSNEVEYAIASATNNEAGNIAEDTLEIGVVIEYDAEKGVTLQDGKLYNTNYTSVYGTFANFAPGTNDFALTVSYDQPIEALGSNIDGYTAPVSGIFETSPTLGVKFSNAAGDRAGLHAYGEGSGRVILNDTWDKEAGMWYDHGNMFTTAGAMFGKLSWGDCYRHATFTYVKSGNYLYCIASADGKAGGLNSTLAPIGSSAKEYVDFLMYTVEINSGTVYFNKSLKSMEYATFQNALLTDVLTNITGAEFRMQVGGNADGSYISNVYASAYGFTYDAEVIKSYADKYANVLKINAGTAEVLVNYEKYNGPIVMTNGTTADVEVTLPNGKIIDTIKNGDADVPYTIEDGYVTFKIAAGFTAGNYDIVVNFRDGKYVDETAVSGKVTLAEGKNDTLNEVVFTMGETTVTAKIGEDGTYTAKLATGFWKATAYTNRLFKSTTVDVTAGEAEAVTLNFTVDRNSERQYEVISNGGLIFNEEDGSLNRNPNQGWVTESAIAGVTFKPSTQILEFNYTMTGMTQHSHYPFLGMFITDGSGMYRICCVDAGDVLQMMTTNHDARLYYGENPAEPWHSFGGKTDYYNWQAHKDYVANGKFHMEFKWIVDGYKFTLKFRSSMSLEKNQDWITVFENVDMKAYMEANKPEIAGGIYGLDADCKFGISCRIDKSDPSINPAKFTNISYSVTNK